MKTYRIFNLCDDNGTRYIGKTDDRLWRVITKYKTDSEARDTPLNIWINDNSSAVRIELIEEVEGDDNAKNSWLRWINEFHACGCELFNANAGKFKVTTPVILKDRTVKVKSTVVKEVKTKEIVTKSTTVKSNKPKEYVYVSRKDPSKTDPVTGKRIVTDETRKKLSNANKGRKRPPEVIERIAEKLRGKTRTDEQKERSRQGQLGRKHPPETLAKMSEVRIGKKATPQAKANMKIAQNRRFENPEEREKCRQAQLKRFGKCQ